MPQWDLLWMLDEKLGDISVIEKEIVDRNLLSGHNKKRKISPQKAKSKLIQNYLASCIKRLYRPLPNSFGGPHGKKSSYKMIELHRQHRYFYWLDIRSAFPSIKLETIVELISSRDDKCSAPLLAKCLARRNFTASGSLIVGYAAAPAIFDLYAHFFLDHELTALSQDYNICCTRYIDDLWFSADQPSPPSFRKGVRKILEQAGFSWSPHKTGLYDLKVQPIKICGIGLAWPAKIFLPRTYLRTIKGALWSAINRGEPSAQVIYGLMSNLLPTLKHRAANKTEKKVLELYHQFRSIYS